MKKIVLFAATLLVVCLSVSAQRATRAPKASNAVQPRSMPQVKMERLGKVEKVTKAGFNPNLVPVKEVISSKKMKDGSEIRLVRLNNGMVKKQLLHGGKKLQRKISLPAESNRNVDLRASAESESMFEGFEGWDIEAEDWDWIPEGWTDESKAGSASHLVDVYGDDYNFTWRTSYFNPKSGRYSVGVQFAFAIDTLSGEDTVTYIPPTPQDEWLILPPVTVKEADYIFAFDLYYDPFFARMNYGVDEDGEEEMVFDGMHTLVEVLISTDGGTTWTTKWDNTSDADQYSEDNLWELSFTGFPWLRVSIDLAEYHNRDIQIAIRYWDDGGESVYVDNVTAGYLLPAVSYRRPEGHLISGYSTEYLAWPPEDVSLIVGHAYTPTLWEGKVENHESVSWTFNEEAGDPAGSFTEQNPLVSLPYGLYDTPLLTATETHGISAEFQLGKGSSEDSWMGLGGQNIWEAEVEPNVTEYVTLGLGNYDLQYRVASYSDVNADSLADIGTFKGVVNYFEKPASKYIFWTFYVHAGNVVAKQDEPVKLDLYAVDEDGYVSELIASSETWPEDFILGFEDDEGNAYHTIPFTFMATDADGREYESYLEIDNHFVAEFYNYQSADILFQYEEHPTGDMHAYISFEEEEKGFLSLGATSALFDMNAAFPYMFVEDNTFAAPNDGGNRDFTVGTYWSTESVEWWFKEVPPEWITVGDPVYQGEDNQALYYTLPVAVAPLPQVISGRSADVTIQSPGCEMTLKFKQGDAEWITALNAVNAKAVKVFNQGDRFVLDCPAGTASVAVYNVAGQKFAEHAVNAAGSCVIPSARLPKGVYILKTAGKTNETVKVVK